MGGTFTSDDGLVTLDFPSGAVTETILITYTRLADNGLPGFSWATPFFELSAETLTGQHLNVFDLPYTLTVNQTPAINNLRLYSHNLNQNRWIIMPTTSAPGGSLSSQIDYFAQFALLADTEAPTTSASLSTSPAVLGWHLADTTVILDSIDIGSGLSNIYYQWDTTETAWQTYTGPISAPEGEHTLNFYSDDMAGNDEPTQALTIKLDKTAPTALVSEPTSGTLAGSHQLIAGLATDNIGVASVDLSIQRASDGAFWDGSLWTATSTALPALLGVGSTNRNFSYIWELPQDDGLDTYTVQAQTKDLVGLSGQISIVEVHVDNMPPQVVSKYPADGASGANVTTTVFVSFHDGGGLDASDLNTNMFYIKDQAGTTVTATLVFDDQTDMAVLTPIGPLDESGHYSVSLLGGVTDVAGNSIVPVTWSFTTVDNQPPQILNEGPTGTVKYYRPLIFSDLLDFGSGLDYQSVNLKLDGQDVTPAVDIINAKVSYLPPDDLDLGLHNVVLTIQDLAGNVATRSWDFKVFGTVVGGQISTDTTWTLANSPYLVGSQVNVSSGADLKIEPGVVIKFGEPFIGIGVSGRLEAIGTATQKIVFTSIKDDQYGGDTNGDATATLPAPGDWGAISKIGSGVVNLENTIVTYGGNSPMINGASVTDSYIAYSAGDGIYTDKAVTNSIIESNLGFGVVQTANSIVGNVIRDNGGGINVRASVLVSSNTIENNIGDGIYVYAYHSPTIQGNLINSNQAAIKQSPGAQTVISNNMVFGNQTNGVLISAGTIADKQIIWAADIPYVVQGRVKFYRGFGGRPTGLTIAPGSVIKLGPDAQIELSQATLNALGTESKRITFTSIKDDAVGGDTNGDGASSPAPGDWRIISASYGAVSHAEVRYGGGANGNSANLYGVAVSDSVISESSGDGLMTNKNVTNSTFTDNDGYGLVMTGGLASGNSVVNNGHGIKVEGTPVVSQNSVQGNDGNGVYVVSRSEALIQENAISGNNAAVKQSASSAPMIYGNGVSGNQVNGILLYSGSDYSSIWRSDLDFIVKGKVSYYGYSPTGITLAPETKVKFDENAELEISSGAYFRAIGTDGGPITFTPLDGGKWKSITASGGVFDNTLIEGGSVQFATVRNSVIRDSESIGVYSGRDIVNNVFANNGYAGLQTFGGSTTGNVFINNKYGIRGSLHNLNIFANTFSGQTDYDLFHNGSTTVTIPGNYGASKTWRVRAFGPGSPPGDYDLDPYRARDLGDPAHAEAGGDPVYTSIGNFFYEHQDLRLPGKGLSLEFKRAYNSLDNLSEGPLGDGWTHNYNVYLRFDTETTTTVTYPKGQKVKFVDTGQDDYISPPGILEKLTKNPDRTHVLTFADQTKFTFDVLGRLASQEDRYGNRTTLIYNNTGYLDQVTGPGGRTLKFTYGPTFISKHTLTQRRLLEEVTDSASRTISFQYADNLVGVTGSRGKTAQYSYDGNNQLTGITEPGATKPFIRNVYGDHEQVVFGIFSGIGGIIGGGGGGIFGGGSVQTIGRGKVIKQYDAFDQLFTYSYDTSEHVTTLVDNKGQTSLHAYDDDYRLIGATDPETHSVSLQYDGLYKPSLTVDQANSTTTMSYDSGGNATEIIDPEGHANQANYDLANNNILWSKDALSRQTTYSYDATGKFMQSIASPIGTTLFDYYTDGLIKTLTDANSHTTDFEYNTFGNLTKVIDAADSSVAMGYDGAGRMTMATDAEGNTSNYTYDSADNILTIADPLALAFPTERHQVNFAYDDRGNQTSFEDANSNLTSFLYDDMNSLTNVVDAHDSTTTYGYDPNYNLESVTDAEGHLTSYGYDVNNRLRSITVMPVNFCKMA